MVSDPARIAAVERWHAPHHFAPFAVPDAIARGAAYKRPLTSTAQPPQPAASNHQRRMYRPPRSMVNRDPHGTTEPRVPQARALAAARPLRRASEISHAVLLIVQRVITLVPRKR
jgi:hypothetical protein